MSTAVTFENATIADVMKRAEAVAPRPKADGGFVSNAGIIMRLRPPHTTVQVSSTNGEAHFDQWITASEISGDPADWRIPVAKFTGILSALPIGSSRTVTLRDSESAYGSILRLESGRTKGEVRLISAEGYPYWEAYSEEGMEAVSGLGDRLARVAWACDPAAEPFSGVLLTGQHLFAANRHQAAMVPCEVPVISQRPITVPIKLLVPILRHSGDVLVGRTENALTISPDDYTQIRVTTFAANIPTPSFISAPYETAVALPRDELVETIGRMLNITKGSRDRERLPVLRMAVGNGQVALHVDGSDDGDWVQDGLDLTGQANHPPITMTFSPKTFTEAVGKATDERIVFCYNVGPNGNNNIVRIDGGDGYMAWFVQWDWQRAAQQ